MPSHTCTRFIPDIDVSGWSSKAYIPGVRLAPRHTTCQRECRACTKCHGRHAPRACAPTASRHNTGCSERRPAPRAYCRERRPAPRPPATLRVRGDPFVRGGRRPTAARESAPDTPTGANESPTLPLGRAAPMVHGTSAPRNTRNGMGAFVTQAASRWTQPPTPCGRCAGDRE